MKHKSPVLVVAFNRPLMLAETLSNLARCDSVSSRDICLYVDGPRNSGDEAKVEGVIDVAKKWGKGLRIIRRETNLGGVPNMISAVSEMLAVYGKTIVVEDDILVSKTFLSFMDEALDMYEDNPKIWAVNGYLDPKMRVPSQYKRDCFLAPRHSAWGWGTWKDRWESVDFKIMDWGEMRQDEAFLRELRIAGDDVVKMLEAEAKGTLNAWDVQCTYYMRKHGLYTLRPCLTLTKNNGFGTECEHCSLPSSRYSKQKYYNFRPRLDHAPTIDAEVLAAFYNSFHRTFVQRVADRVNRFYLDYFGDPNRYPITIKR